MLFYSPLCSKIALLRSITVLIAYLMLQQTLSSKPGVGKFGPREFCPAEFSWN